MPVDASVFSNIHNYQDYNMANQDFLARQKAAQLDAASKANILKGQSLYAAAQSGDQGIYSQTLQKLAQNGIDVSDVPQDVATGTKYAEGLRLAQSPLGSLLGAASKLDSNQIAANTASGAATPNPNAMAAAVLSGAALPSTPAMTVTPAQAKTQPPSAFTGTPATAEATTQLFDPTNDPKLAPTSTGPAVPPALATVNNAPQNGPAMGNAPVFVPPTRDPNLTQAANQQAYQQALDNFNARPDVKRSNASATKGGELEAVDSESALKAKELTDRLTQNLMAMKQLNSAVPSTGLIPASTKVWASQALKANNLGSGNEASASQQWDKINNQQVISEIQQFLASGGAGARINQTLDKIMRAASSINSGDQPESRGAQIDAALAEIANKNISAQNVVAKENGQASQPYENIPVQTGAPSISKQDAINELRRRGKI